MKLRSQILAYGLCGAIAAAGVGAVGWWASASQARSQAAMMAAAEAARTSMEGDMMHDAIRGDALTALVAALTQNAAQRDEAQADLKDHGTRFLESLVALKGIGLPAATEAEVDKIVPTVKGYVAAAQAIVDAAAREAAAAQALVPAFSEQFVRLEDEMEHLGDRIADDAKDRQALSTSTSTWAQWLLGLGVLGAFAVLGGVAVGLARSMSVPMTHAVDIAQRIGRGDLTGTVTVQGSDETRQLLGSMEDLQRRLGAIVSEVRLNAERVAMASAEISQGNSDLSARTEQQASSLQQTAASMEELGATVQQNAEHARQANDLAHTASQVATQGGDVVGRVVETMKGINDSSRRIADIISVIDGIAFQTNILALNAAVEAARAGEQGRGFAVVAGEVRSLAHRSAQAAKEIKQLIAASVERVENGTSQVNDAGSTMSEVVASIRRVTAIMTDITAASQQQSAGVTQVGQAVSGMDQTTQQNAALVEQSAAAAESLKTQAQQLVDAVAVFKLAAGV